MTAKSRRRKVLRQRQKKEPLWLYKFTTPSKSVYIEARSSDHAKTLFQEKYGYWPREEDSHGKLQ